jgi:hypothetical protein
MEANRTPRGRLALVASLAALALALLGPGTAQAKLPPQGMYEGCAPKSTTMDCGQRLQAMADAGFKYVLNYSSWYGSADQVRGFADQAAAVGMQVIWPLNHPAWRDEDELSDNYPDMADDCGCDTNPDFREFAVNMVKDHPATWGFYVGDEQLPTADNVAKILALSQEVRQLAPGKPTLFVTLPHEDLTAYIEPFLPAADFGATDYYPVGLEPNLNRFPKVAAENRAVNTKNGTHASMVLQAFSWAQYYPSAYPDARFPTRAEMQRMRDLAITHGQPEMLLWYAYNDVMDSSNPAKHWADVRAAAFAPHIEMQGIPSRCSGRRVRLGVKVRADSKLRQVRVLVDGRVMRSSARTRVGVALRSLDSGRHSVRVVATDRRGKRAKVTAGFRRCA